MRAGARHARGEVFPSGDPDTGRLAWAVLRKRVMGLDSPDVATVASRRPALATPARRRRWLKHLLQLLAVLVLVAIPIRQRFFVPVPARSHVVDRGDVVREVFGRGTIESRREVDLGFDLVGRISDLLVDEGDHVKLGQVVGHLAPEQFTADVRSASSGISLAQAAIARLDAEERRALRDAGIRGGR
jgi:multidrug efflux pump subunit AcrA (membrane-fusion protein)